MTKIISHRGANLLAPQNTLPAFEKALELGADGFENDVHATADGEIVVCHNFRVNKTSDGKGRISDLTLAQLRRLDFGSWFSPEFAGTRIPTLSEFLDLCHGLDIIDIEIKSPQPKGSDIVRKTIDAVKERGLFGKLLISSFDPDILVECKNVDAETKTGFLYAPNRLYSSLRALTDLVGFIGKIGADAVHPHRVFVDEKYVAVCRAAGIRVNPWTVNREDIMLRLCAWGCDGIITDDPALARRVIRKV